MFSLSPSRTLTLTERIPHVARLAPADVAFLLEQHRGGIEILPTDRRDRYRLTALGCVGTIIAPTCRLVIRPKIPLANVFAMLDPLASLPAKRDALTVENGTEVLEFLAGQLSCRLTERIRVGLHRAFREHSEHGAVLHGQLDLTAQLRDAPGRKEQLHGRVDDLSVDVPCNRVARATVELLLASPLVGENVKVALWQALAGLGEVSSAPLSPLSWEEIDSQRVPDEYRGLLDLCRLLADGLTPGGMSGSVAASSFLLDLERVFERYVTRGVVEAFASSRRYAVTVQAPHTVTHSALDLPDVAMRPDVTIDREGRPVVIVDAKWKRFAANVDTADLHQMLAYGTALGAEQVVLVYPGGKSGRWQYRFTQTPLRLTICSLKVTGERAACERSLTRLGRSLRAALERANKLR